MNLRSLIFSAFVSLALSIGSPLQAALVIGINYSGGGNQMGKPLCFGAIKWVNLIDE